MFISKGNKAILDLNKNIEKMTIEKLDKNYLLKKELVSQTIDQNLNKVKHEKVTTTQIIPIKKELIKPVEIEVNSQKFNYSSKTKNKEFGKDILQSFKYHFAYKLMKNFRIFSFKSKLSKLYRKIKVK